MQPIKIFNLSFNLNANLELMGDRNPLNKLLELNVHVEKKCGSLNRNQPRALDHLNVKHHKSLNN